MYRMFANQTELRNQLKREVNDLLEKSLSNDYSFQMYYLALLQRLRKELDDCKGKKVYGYLPKEVKHYVDFIVAQIAKDTGIASLYENSTPESTRTVNKKSNTFLRQSMDQSV